MRKYKNSEQSLLNVFDHKYSFIEANAGSGKTWSIILIYLVAILKNKVDPKSILLISYTRASASQLRSRIYEALAQLRLYLSGGPDNQLILAVIDELVDIDKQDLIAYLDLVLSKLVDIQCYTFHAYCSRSLNNYDDSYSSRVSDTSTKTDDIIVANILKSVILSQEFINQLHPNIVDIWMPNILDKLYNYKSIKNLISTLKNFNDFRFFIKKDIDHTRNIAHLNKLKSKLYEMASSEWNLILAELSKSNFKANCIKQEDIPHYLELCVLDPSNKKLSKLSSTYIEKALRKNSYIPKHEIFLVIEEYLHIYESIKNAASELDALFIYELWSSYTIEELNIYKKLRINNAYASIKDFAKAIDYETYLNKVRSEFDLILIDEFQDIDSLQFNLIYTIWHSVPSNIIMLGDPKQAIYQFRGADVHAYINIRDILSKNDSFYYINLLNNYRSAKPLVKWINNLFLRNKNAFVLEGLKFQASVSNIDFKISDKSYDKAVVVWEVEDDKACAKSDIANLIAKEILRLMNEVYLGSKLVIEEDISIIVRTNAQADLISNALQAHNIKHWSSKISGVSDKRATLDLYALSLVILNISDIGIFRGLRYTRLFASYSDNYNEGGELYYYLSHANSVLRKQGILGLIRTILSKYSDIKRGDSIDLDQYIDELIHVCNLIDKEHAVLDARGFLNSMESILSPDYNGDILRTPASNAVHIITQHYSKGIEYEIVFCPFNYLEDRKPPSTWHINEFHVDGKLNIGINLAKNTKEYLSYLKENLAEGVRLNYVSFTRAKQRLYLFVSKQLNKKTAINWLMSPLSSIDEFLVSDSDSECLETDRILEYKTINNAIEHSCDSLFDIPEAPKYIICSSSSFSSIFSSSADYSDAIINKADGFAGRELGILVHKIMECIDKLDYTSWPALFNKWTDRIVSPKFRKEALDFLNNNIARWLTAKLPGINASMMEIDKSKIIFEYEFSFPVKSFNLGDLYPGNYKSVGVCNDGYIKGFIDCLIFHNNSYYIIDWKTNNLSDYSEYGLRQSMEDSGYIYQAAIYALGLHSYIKNAGLNTPLAGIIYVYIRGNENLSTWLWEPDLKELDGMYITAHANQ